MFDPPIGDGANLFIIITVALIAFGAALANIDIIKEMKKKPEDDD